MGKVGRYMVLCMAALCARGSSGGEMFHLGQPYLIKNGERCADIVISETPARSVKFAASELQEFLFRITGAKLAVTHAPGTNVSAHIYVGRSAETDRMKITDAGLKYGAFRMVSSKDCLVLLGHDADFAPREPWGHNHEDRFRVFKEWDALTGATWGNPLMSEHRRYSPELDLWEADERGSLNAVYEFLRGLGCRWYAPGQLGEILPKLKSVAIPKVDRTVHPDFASRHMFFYYHEFWMAHKGIPAEYGSDDIKWQLRLGLYAHEEVLGHALAHGIMVVH